MIHIERAETDELGKPGRTLEDIFNLCTMDCFRSLGERNEHLWELLCY